MKLSKDSWHYRNFEAWKQNSHSMKHRDLRSGELMRDDNGRLMLDDNYKPVSYPPRQPDLCTYTRIALLWGPMHRLNKWGDDHPTKFGALVVTAVVVVLGVVGHLLALVSDLTFAAWWHPFAWVAAITVGAAATIALALVLSWFSVDIVGPWWRSRKGDKPKHSSIVVERVKAHKQKVCPTIEFEEDQIARETVRS